MDNYEVNVLTRKGGWKKLQQEMKSTNDISNKSLENSVVKNESKDFPLKTEDEKKFVSNNVFHNFDAVNEIIGDLQNLEHQKTNLIEKSKKIKR